MFSRTRIMTSTGTYSDNVGRLKKALAEADTVVIGAGAGLSTSAGFVYSGERFETFLRTCKDKVLFLELGVGYNTPGIIKYPFWRMTAQNPNATYACVNYGEAVCPKEIMNQSICVDGDIGEVIRTLEQE